LPQILTDSLGDPKLWWGWTCCQEVGKVFINCQILFIFQQNWST